MATSAVPPRSLVQRLEALALANEVRCYRAQLKRDLKARRRQVSDVLDDPLLATMKVAELLLATPGRGRVKVNVILRHFHISPSKTLGGMSQRQREALARFLRLSE